MNAISRPPRPPLEIVAFEPEGPQPLVRDVPPGEPFPLHALGPLREAVEAIHDITQAPVAICAQSVLGATALTVQAIADCETLHGKAPTSEFFLTIAESGSRKSACDRLAMSPIRDFEEQLREERKGLVRKWQDEKDIYDTQRAEILKRVKKGAFEAQADLQALVEPEMPLEASITSPEPTIEGITKNLGQMRPSLGLFSDEGGSFIGGYAMNAENRAKSTAWFSKLWDGAPVERWRAGDGISSFCGRRVSAHVMVQPVIATGLLADPLANGQGILARFLTVAPASAAGTRTRSGHSSASDAALERFGAHIGGLLRRDLPLKAGTRNELQLRVLTLSEEARAHLQEFAIEVEKAQAPGAALENIRPFASKAAEHAARLAAILTLFDDPDASEVSAGMLANGIDLANFYIGEACRLANEAVISSETAEAERLRKWLSDSFTEQHISLTDATQRGLFRETAKNRKLFKVLVDAGWLIPIDGGAIILGRHRREAFLIRRGPA